MINTILDKYNNFPSTNEMANHAREIYNSSFKIKSNQILSSPDRILLNWINTEYDLFKSFEEKVYSNQYKQSFNSCQELIDFSNTILNRRKSRAGKSLENHLSSIFTIADLQFEEQAVTEDNKKPDFLFPSSEAYHNILFPTDQLIFLGAKTTCKDRWRQVLNEASTTVVEMHNELRDTPKTGDNSNVGLWTALAGLSALGIVGTAIIAYRKKKKEDNE